MYIFLNPCNRKLISKLYHRISLLTLCPGAFRVLPFDSYVRWTQWQCWRSGGSTKTQASYRRKAIDSVLEIFPSVTRRHIYEFFSQAGYIKNQYVPRYNEKGINIRRVLFMQYFLKSRCGKCLVVNTRNWS